MERRRIGHYTLVSELGRGGMGVVYKAHEESLNRYVALKVLGEQLAADPTFVARFVREAQAAAGLTHPNIIQIYFIGEDAGRHYFVMEYVSGKTLQALVREQGRIPKETAVQYMLQAAHGLAAAHAVGLIHRDVKPSNLMVNEHGLLKIADFGLALPQDALTRLTVSGLLVGTPGYLSPEQCRGEKPDRRSDIYSLGVTFYEILTGQLPFQGDSPLALIRKILDEEPPDITGLAGEIDEELRATVNRMIAKDPSQRVQDCRALAACLEAYLRRHGVAGVTPGTTLAPGTGSEPQVGVRAAPLAAAQAGMATKPTIPLIPEQEVEAAPPQPQGPPLLDVAAEIVPVQQAAPAVLPRAVRPSSRRGVAVAVLMLGVVAVALFAGALALVRRPLLTKILPAFASAGSRDAVSGGEGIGSTSGDQAGRSGAEPGAGSVEGGMPDTGGSSERAGGATNVGSERAAGAGAVRQAVTDSARRSNPLATGATPAPVALIAAVGEEGLSAVVGTRLVMSLNNLGMESADAATLPYLAESSASGAGVEELLRLAGAQGMDLLVQARVDPAGERVLEYMGRRDVAYRSRVTLTCYDVATGGLRAAPLTVELDYTALNRDQVVDRRISELARELLESLQ